MVNRGGRSKGCITCKRRRVKCDEAKPTCSTCAQVGYKCDGYQPFSFIDERPRVAKTCQSKTPPRSSVSPRNVPSPEVSELSEVSVEDVALAKVQQSFVGLPSRLRNKLAVQPIPPFLDLQGFQDDIFSWFALKHLPLAFDFDEWRQCDKPKIYSPFLVANQNTSGVSKVCFNALASTFFGKVQGHAPSLALGARNYGLALRSLHTMLRNPSAESYDDIVAAVSLLVVYECLTNTSLLAWLQHSKGLAHLMQLWGPYCFQSHIGLRLLAENRHQIINTFCIKRRRCFLADLSWRTVPFEKTPGVRTPLQTILDIYAHIPGLMEARDDAVNLPDGILRTSEIEAVSDQILTCLNLAETWYKQWRLSHPDEISWQTLHGLVPFRDDDGNFEGDAPGELTFRGIISGKAFVIYHGIRILAYWLLLSLTARSWPGPRPDWPWADLSQPAVPEWGRRIDCSIAAILAAANDLRAPRHGANLFLLGPLRIVVFAARAQQREKSRLLLQTMAGTLPDLPNTPHSVTRVWAMAKSVSINPFEGRVSELMSVAGDPWRRGVHQKPDADWLIP